MTVGNTARVVSYVASGSTTTFAVPFQFFEIEVYAGGLLVSPGSYSITQSEPGLSGSVVFGVAPVASTKVSIKGATLITQQTDYVEGAAFPAQSHERALDRLTMALQEARLDASATGYSYAWDTQTTAGDPGTGEIRGNHASLASITALYVSATDFWGSDLRAVFTPLFTGQPIRLVEAGALNNAVSFRATGVPMDNTTYFTIPVTAIASLGAFANGDKIGIDVGGAQGIQGVAGPPNVLTASVATGSPGSAASIVVSGTSPAQDFAFTLPRGDVGPAGPANVLSVASTTTGAPGSAAAVAISGTSPTQALDFTLPRGDVGPAGPNYGGTSTTSLAVATGSVTIATQAGLAWQVGNAISLHNAASGAYLDGVITAYATTSMTIQVSNVGGAGTYASWVLGPRRGIKGDTGGVGPTGSAGADGTLIGSYIKAPAFCATTGPITLSGLQTIDSNVLVGGERVVVWQQTTKSQNGIYVAASGAWARATDNDSAAEMSGALVLVLGNNLGQHRHKLFRQTASVATLGTDDVIWQEESQGGSVQQNAGLTRGVLITLGDSNFGGRPGWWDAINREFRHARSPFGTWTHYNNGLSGYTFNGFISTIVTGNQSAAANDTNPSIPGTVWDGNAWTVFNEGKNADRGGIIILSLGINDLNTPVNRAGYGSVTQFPKNLETTVNALLAMLPRFAILLAIPAPYAGEDFIQAPSFTTDWASDSPDGTIDTGAATASARIRAAYLAWVNRHPRVSVWDSAELFGVRCDDKAVDGQDPEGQGALLDDSLHFSTLAARRITQYLLRFMGVDRRMRNDTATDISNVTLIDQVVAGRWANYNTLSNSGANTSIRFRVSPEHVFLQQALPHRRNANLLIPTHLADDAERALYLGDLGHMKWILGLTRDIRAYFPATGNIHTPTAVRLSSAATNPDGTREYTCFLDGLNLAGTEATSGNVYIFTTSEQGIPFTRRSMTFNIDGTAGGGSAHNPYPVTWLPTTCQFARGVGTNQIDVKVYASNQNDGRLVDGALNSGTAPGMIVWEATLNNGIYQATLTLNATNWPSGFTFKSGDAAVGYRLVGRVTSGTLVGQGSFTIR